MSLEALYWKVNKDDHIKYNIQITGSTKKEVLAAAHQLRDWDLKRACSDYEKNLDTKIMSKSFKTEEKWEEFAKTLSFSLQELVFRTRKVK